MRCKGFVDFVNDNRMNCKVQMLALIGKLRTRSASTRHGSYASSVFWMRVAASVASLTRKDSMPTEQIVSLSRRENHFRSIPAQLRLLVL